MTATPRQTRWILLLLAAVVCGALAQWRVLWKTTLPLGVPGEWVWERLSLQMPLFAVIWPAVVVALFLMGYVWLGGDWLARGTRTRRIGLLLGLWGLGFLWLLSLVASTPGIASLSRIPFVLFYERSSGYFTQATEHRDDPGGFLKGYLTQIQDSTNPENHLHLGTHPPGLTLGLMSLSNLCDRYPGLVALIKATQPVQIRDGNDAVRETELARGKSHFSDADGAVLWLGALITAVMASGTCVPLYLLARRFVDPESAWWTAAIWLLVPASAAFLPKSDIMFPWLAMWAQWLWLKALDRDSLGLGALTGIVMCVAMTLSLAFVPVALIMFIQCGVLPKAATSDLPVQKMQWSRFNVIVGGAIALGGWLLLWALLGKMNLFAVWIQNIRNHASFYSHHVRTYIPWLFENPVELVFALGFPLAIMAIVGIVFAFRTRPPRYWELLLPLIVWGVLWLSGKNMGEAARLWVFLMPYPVWCASLAISRLTTTWLGSRTLMVFYALQIIICIATAIRIDGFGFGELGAG
ncbi:hypothetical protein [Planctomicrobium sp. SH527]|uniref:hypothetical protein n=1 Tax=Planctomicrobium sp. SH527 TaxID=3448123 RepID=UPI003F5C21C1